MTKACPLDARYDCLAYGRVLAWNWPYSCERKPSTTLTLGDFADIIGIVRDVFLVLIVLVCLFVLVALYRKLSAVLESAKRAVDSVDEVVGTVSEKIVGPAAAGSDVAFGLGKAMAFFSGLRSKNSKGD